MITIDYQDRRPLYEQITERFTNLILSGVLEPESRMPSVRKLAMDLSINPNTIQRAYQELERQGLIYPVKGRGNYVSSDVRVSERKKQQYELEFKELVLQGKRTVYTMLELMELMTDVYDEVDL